MAQNDRDWDELSRRVQDIVDRAVNSQDYQKLNQTIRQAVDKAVDLGGEAVRRATEQKPRPTVVEQARPMPVLYGSTGGKAAAGVVKIVGGALLGSLSFVLLLGAMVLAFTGSGAVPLLLSLGAVGGGIWLLVSGIRTMERLKRFRLYRRALGSKTFCTLENLARSVGKSVDFVRRELERMIRSGLFLEGHLDREGTCLIVSHETFREFERSRLALEERQRQEAAEQARRQQLADARDPQLQEVLDRGDEFIRQIRRCNDAIPGPEISAKIDRMEIIVRKIFLRAEQDPQIVPDLKRLMDYYLPMTVKLLSAYAEMDAQPIQGPTIAASKREIEQTLDTLNLAYEKLLDAVFQDTALDISSDISVLNTLLAQEGLTQDELSKMKGDRPHK